MFDRSYLQSDDSYSQISSLVETYNSRQTQSVDEVGFTSVPAASEEQLVWDAATHLKG